MHKAQIDIKNIKKEKKNTLSLYQFTSSMFGGGGEISLAELRMLLCEHVNTIRQRDMQDSRSDLETITVPSVIIGSRISHASVS